MPDIIKCQECGIIVGQYVSLAEYQELKDKAIVCANDVIRLVALLKRWNEIAPDLFNDELFNTNPLMLEWTPTKSDELTQLIQNTSEVLK